MAVEELLIDADGHILEPPDLWEKHIEPMYRDRVPRIITDEKGVQWRYCEGYRPDRVRVMSFEGEDWVRSKAGAEVQDRIRIAQCPTHHLRRTDIADEQLDSAVQIIRWLTFRAVDLRVQIIERPNAVTVA